MAFNILYGKGLYKAGITKGLLDTIIYDGIRLDNRPDCSIIKKRLLRSKCGVYDGSSEFEQAMGHIAYEPRMIFGAHDQLKSMISLYTTQGIREVFGYNLTEFLSLSNAETSLILDAASKKMAKKDSAMNEMMKGFDLNNIGVEDD